MSLKIHVTKVKGYDFTGWVNIDDLSNAQLDALRINRDTWHTDCIEVEGEFSVSAYSYDDCEIDSIDGINLVGADTALGEAVLNLEDGEYDLEDLHDQIMSHSDMGEWIQDQKDAKYEYCGE